MLPPSSETITFLCWLFRRLSTLRVPGLSSCAKWLDVKIMSNFGGYIHAGNMRYLTNCSSGNYEKVKLLYSVSIFRRVKGFFLRKLPWKKFVKDHSIGIYKSKLLVVAENRNP